MCQPSGDSCPGTELPLSDVWSIPAKLPNAYTLMPNILIERVQHVLKCASKWISHEETGEWMRSLHANIEAHLERSGDPIQEAKAAEHYAYEFLATYYESKGGWQVTADLIRLGEVEGTMSTRETLVVLARALYGAQACGWEPIDSCPMNGTTILGMTVNEQDSQGFPLAYPCRFEPHVGEFRSNVDDSLVEPTHWANHKLMLSGHNIRRTP